MLAWYDIHLLIISLLSNIHKIMFEFSEFIPLLYPLQNISCQCWITLAAEKPKSLIRRILRIPLIVTQYLWIELPLKLTRFFLGCRLLKEGCFPRKNWFKHSARKIKLADTSETNGLTFLEAEGYSIICWYAIMKFLKFNNLTSCTSNDSKSFQAVISIWCPNTGGC